MANKQDKKDEQNYNDEEAMKIIALQDERSGEVYMQLHGKYFKEIFHFLRSKTNDVIHAEELTAEVFCRLWQYAKSYKNENKFESWLISIADNVYKDFIKNESKRSNILRRLENFNEPAQTNSILLTLIEWA